MATLRTLVRRRDRLSDQLHAATMKCFDASRAAGGTYRDTLSEALARLGDDHPLVVARWAIAERLDATIVEIRHP